LVYVAQGRAGNKGTAYTFVAPTQRDIIPDMVRALTSSGKPVPKDLRAIANSIKEEKKKGNKVAKGSGFGESCLFRVFSSPPL